MSTQLSISEAATVLGKTERQIRYMIKMGRLPAKKPGGRWVIESEDLPLSVAQREALGRRVDAARGAFEKGVGPADKAGGGQDGAGSRKRLYSVTELDAFRLGSELYRTTRDQLGPDAPPSQRLFECLARVTRGCHTFHPADKAARFGEARDAASLAVAHLLLDGEAADEGRRALALRIEHELIPAVARLIATHERRSRRSRFERFDRSDRSRGGAAGR